MTELGSNEFWNRLRDDPERLAAEVVLIDTSRLDEMLVRHASLRAWVNAVHETARVGEDRAKWEVNKARAKAMLEARAGDVKKTVPVLNAEVEQDANVISAEEALLDAQHKRGALRAMVIALEDRKDMLVQIAAKRRKEMEEYS